jgi:hypothetical protein
MTPIDYKTDHISLLEIDPRDITKEFEEAVKCGEFIEEEGE